MKKIAFLIIIALFPVSLYSQVETHYYQNGDIIHSEFGKIKGLGNNNVVKMPEFDIQELIEEDKRTENTNSPYRFGKAFNVSFNLNDGTWTNVENGRLWTMSFSSEGALSLNFVFDDFHLPEGAELYIENQKGTVLYGPVKTKDIPKSGFFLTDIIPGSQVKIYIFEPSDVKGTSTLTIRRVVHGYRGNLTSDPYGNVGGSASCHIDVACEPSYAEESNAVALILLSGGNYWCSGSLQMATDLSFKPYFLTAFHCADSNKNKELSDSEISNAEAWMFKFFFKKTTCGGTDYTGTTYNSATFRAGYAFSDFLLMEINHNLKQNSSLTWLGWDKSGNVPSSGVCIQHPNGDLMKIAISDNSAITSSFNGYSNNGWRMRWNSNGGVTQRGSSGSPLLNQNKKVVGQVYGKNPEDINESNEICGRKNTHFGKFSLSWTGGGHTYDKLSNWLDPVGTNQTTTNSSSPISIEGDLYTSTSNVYYVENLPSGYTVTWSLSDIYYNQNCLQQNNPSQNQCKITCDNSHVMLNATLTANIKYNGVTVQTLTMTGLFAYRYWGHYTSGNLSDNIDYTYFFHIRPNATTYITSPLLVGATASYSSTGATPSIWGFSSSNGDITFVTSNTSAPVIINVDDAYGNHYTLYASPASYYNINVFNEEDGFIVTLVEDGSSERNLSLDLSWTVEVRSATTGELMTTQPSTSRSETISTTGWPKGVYIVKVTIGKEEFTEKVVVK